LKDRLFEAANFQHFFAAHVSFAPFLTLRKGEEFVLYLGIKDLQV
jgi:hypothetical protein